MLHALRKVRGVGRVPVLVISLDDTSEEMIGLVESVSALYLSIYLSIYPSIHLSIYLSIDSFFPPDFGIESRVRLILCQYG